VPPLIRPRLHLLSQPILGPPDAPQAPVTIPAIGGVTPPETGETPVSAITATAQFTGTVEWEPTPGTGGFGANTAYTAIITLTILPGYTLDGVTVTFFSVAGTTIVTRVGNEVTAVFPETTP